MIRIKKPKFKKFFLFFFLIIITLSCIVAIFPLSPFVVTDGDIIKNFDFKTIGSTPISYGGGVYNNKLKFEKGSAWTISKDDIEFISTTIQGDTVYLHYRLKVHNTINIYTNVRLTDACERLHQKSATYEIAHLRYCGVFGCTPEPFDEWYAYITWNYWDFGNIRSFNGQHNSYSGDLKMTFDIVDTTPPNFFEDNQGNSIVKDFEYIVVNSAGVDGSVIGKLSEDKPDIVGVIPEERTSERSDWNGGDPENFHGLQMGWYPDIEMNPVIPPDSWDEGIQPQSVGSSLNPKLKNGNNIPYGDARLSCESQLDGSIYYNLGRISPVVHEYYGTLSWIYHDMEIADYYEGFTAKIKIVKNNRLSRSETKPIALHVQNRYIQSDIFVNFDIWTAYDMVIKPGNTIPLDPPQEFYTDLTWLSIVSGHGGGEFYYDIGTQWFEFFGNIMFWIFAIIFVSVGLYVFIQVNKVLKAKKKLERS